MSRQEKKLELLNENGMNAYRYHLYDNAIEYFSRIISIKENSSNKNEINHFLWLRAFCYFNKGEYQEAISNFYKCIDNDYLNSKYFDQNTDPFYWIGICELEYKDFKSAISSFTKSLNYFSENPITIYHLAICKFLLGDLEGTKADIINFFILASQKDKSLINSTSLYMRGMCFYHLNNELKLAAKDFSKVLKISFREFNGLDENYLDEETNELFFLRGKYYYEILFGELEIEMTNLVLKYFPDDSQALFNKALYFRQLNQLKDSRKELLLAIENCTDNSTKKIYIEFKNELEEKIRITSNDNLIEANVNNAGHNESDIKSNEEMGITYYEDYIESNENNENNENNKINQEELKQSRKRLNELIGLDNIKKEIENIISFTLLQIQREKVGLKPEFISNNFIFLGSPGTGKTEVARLIGKILRSLGVLTKGHFIETDRAGLIGTYLGETSNKTLLVCQKALGGVLFIDEAYSLTSQLKGDYGNEAIATLLKFMEDNRDNISIIVAGYPYEMETFLDSNSGLRSRFGTQLTFKDYLPEELFQILLLMINQRERKIKDTSLKYVEELVLKISLNKNKNFGNARSIRNLIEIVIKNQSLRLIKNVSNTKEDLINLLDEDFYLNDEQLINL